MYLRPNVPAAKRTCGQTLPGQMYRGETCPVKCTFTILSMSGFWVFEILSVWDFDFDFERMPKFNRTL
jgi:hypothetical protein